MYIKATATIADTEVAPDLIIDALTKACHIIDTQALTIIDVTYCTEGHLHVEVPPPNPETTADLDHILHTNPVGQHLLNLHPVLTKQQQNIRIGNLRVIIDDPQSDYYSLDNASSDSDDDLNKEALS